MSDNVLLETDENDATIAAYTHKPGLFGKLLFQIRGGAASSYHYDGKNSTRQLTDETQDVTDTATYSAFGEVVAKTGSTTNPFGYKGAVGYYTNSTTEDLYVRARTYEPVRGRWLSKDPIGFVDGPNLYRAYFVPNGNDPTGLVEVKHLKRGNDPRCRTKLVKRGRGMERVNLPVFGRKTYIFGVTGKWPCRGREGVFVQKVSVNCNLQRLRDCANNLTHMENFHYWEAFFVNKNSPKDDDTAAFGSSFRSGSYRQNGIIKFYCLKPLKEKSAAANEIDGEKEFSSWRQKLKPPFIQIPNNKSPCRTSPGNLKFTRKQPSFWNRDSVDGKTAGRRAILKWDCCCGRKSYARMSVLPKPK